MATTIHRRIKKLEAEKRKAEKQLRIAETGEESIYYSSKLSDKQKDRLRQYINHYNTRLQIEREKYEASGGIATDKLKLKAGDVVQTRHGKATIEKVNSKTVKIIYHNPAITMLSGNVPKDHIHAKLDEKAPKAFQPKKKVSTGSFKSRLPLEMKSAFKKKPYDLEAISKYISSKKGEKVSIGTFGDGYWIRYPERAENYGHTERAKGLMKMVVDA